MEGILLKKIIREIYFNTSKIGFSSPRNALALVVGVITAPLFDSLLISSSHGVFLKPYLYYQSRLISNPKVMCFGYNTDHKKTKFSDSKTH